MGGNVPYCNAIPALSQELISRFWNLIDRRGPDECWPWLGSTTKGVRGGQRYGIWYIKIDSVRFNLRPHRISRTILVGPIPDDLTLDHVKERCQNTLCCNPNHTEPVTQSVNSMRRNGATATVCGNGHPRQPGTKCGECNIAAQRRYQKKRRSRREVSL